jgi:hypothetical protein
MATLTPMNNTTLKTIAIPGLGSTEPTSIATAVGVPARVVIRNISGVALFLGTASADILDSFGSPSGQTFRVPPGQEAVLVIAPGQSIYAIMGGIGALVSVAQSDAYPLT